MQIHAQGFFQLLKTYGFRSPEISVIIEGLNKNLDPFSTLVPGLVETKRSHRRPFRPPPLKVNQDELI